MKRYAITASESIYCIIAVAGLIPECCCVPIPSSRHTPNPVSQMSMLESVELSPIIQAAKRGLLDEVKRLVEEDPMNVYRKDPLVLNALH